MFTLTLPEHQHIVIRSWLGEAVWISPDEVLAEMLALDKRVSPQLSVDLSDEERSLLAAYLDYVLEERLLDDGDAPVLEQVIKMLEPAQ